MHPSIARLPKHLRSNRGRELGLLSAKAWKPSTPTAETLRKRALFDARGKIELEGCTYTSTGKTHWQVVRSIEGRTDQYDLIANGKVVRTCGPRRIPKCFRP